MYTFSRLSDILVETNIFALWDCYFWYRFWRQKAWEFQQRAGWAWAQKEGSVGCAEEGDRRTTPKVGKHLENYSK